MGLSDAAVDGVASGPLGGRGGVEENHMRHRCFGNQMSKREAMTCSPKLIICVCVSVYERQKKRNMLFSRLQWF